jgi:ABC-2 type transport system permease protein
VPSTSITNRSPALAWFGLRRGARAWRATLTAFISDSLVYRANAVIWILTDVVTAVTMPLIWLASYNGRHEIQGFSPSQMVVYYLVILAVTSFVESHMMWEMSSDIKQGRFNNYLIRPFSYIGYTYAGNLGYRVVRTTVALPIFALVVLAFHHYIPPTMHFNIGPVFWLSVLLGHFVSFVVTYSMGLLSLWLYEARSVYNFYYLPQMIFSGQIAPLALLPHAFRVLVNYLPFPYTLAFPANVFLMRLSRLDVLLGLGAQLFWIVVGLVAALLLWRGGLRRYTAFGV